MNKQNKTNKQNKRSKQTADFVWAIYKQTLIRQQNKKERRRRININK